MRVEALAIALRPRPMAEACDLGVALVRRHAAARSGAASLPLSCGGHAGAVHRGVRFGWLPILIVFWLKPWLDRSLLFILSRAVFGQPRAGATCGAQRPRCWGGQLLRTLLWRRLSPWRSYTQAVDQLEGQRGGARRKRRKQLLNGQPRRGRRRCSLFAQRRDRADLCRPLHPVLVHAGNRLADVWRWLIHPNRTLPGLGSLALVTLATSVLVEPFFVAAGFAMYLNRRVELEAWDIEQEFRRAFA
jgi:hypothetical protein